MRNGRSRRQQLLSAVFSNDQPTQRNPQRNPTNSPLPPQVAALRSLPPPLLPPPCSLGSLNNNANRVPRTCFSRAQRSPQRSPHVPCHTQATFTQHVEEPANATVTLNALFERGLHAGGMRYFEWILGMSPLPVASSVATRMPRRSTQTFRGHWLLEEGMKSGITAVRAPLREQQDGVQWERFLSETRGGGIDSTIDNESRFPLDADSEVIAVAGDL